ncbi:transmembrane protein 252-like [Sardina pilchardus]|uniref:transmembrane protein 252-like n=1 Tax=Sardina pilchardus TaxID=27697 RepID=UPI002E10D55B
MMDKGTRLGTVLRLVFLFSGFCLICLGAYVKSLDPGSDSSVKAIIAYLLVTCGFLLLLIGAFWSIIHGLKTNLYRRGGSRRPSSQVYVYTVDRPNFYPPSYEESQSRSHTVIPIDQAYLSMAPPLYTLTCSEVVNEDFSHELPPSYQQAFSQNLPVSDQLSLEARPHLHNDDNSTAHQ